MGKILNKYNEGILLSIGNEYVKIKHISSAKSSGLQFKVFRISIFMFISFDQRFAIFFWLKYKTKKNARNIFRFKQIVLLQLEYKSFVFYDLKDSKFI